MVSTRRRISDRPKQGGWKLHGMRAQARHRMSQARGVAAGWVKTALGMRSGARTGVALSLLLLCSPPFGLGASHGGYFRFQRCDHNFGIQFHDSAVHSWSGCEFPHGRVAMDIGAIPPRRLRRSLRLTAANLPERAQQYPQYAPGEMWFLRAPNGSGHHDYSHDECIWRGSVVLLCALRKVSAVSRR